MGPEKRFKVPEAGNDQPVGRAAASIRSPAKREAARGGGPRHREMEK